MEYLHTFSLREQELRTKECVVPTPEEGARKLQKWRRRIQALLCLVVMPIIYEVLCLLQAYRLSCWEVGLAQQYRDQA